MITTQDNGETRMADKVFVLLTDDLLEAHPEIAGEQLVPWKQDTACFYADEKQKVQSENGFMKKNHNKNKIDGISGGISGKHKPEKSSNKRPAAVGTYFYA